MKNEEKQSFERRRKESTHTIRFAGGRGDDVFNLWGRRKKTDSKDTLPSQMNECLTMFLLKTLKSSRKVRHSFPKNVMSFFPNFVDQFFFPSSFFSSNSPVMRMKERMLVPKAVMKRQKLSRRKKQSKRTDSLRGWRTVAVVVNREMKNWTRLQHRLKEL